MRQNSVAWNAYSCGTSLSVNKGPYLRIAFTLNQACEFCSEHLLMALEMYGSGYIGLHSNNTNAV